MEDPRSTKPQPIFKGEKEQEPPGMETAMKTRPDHGEKSYVGFGRLLGKKALVTGGDSGIGKAVALAFAREGADVACAYLDEHEDAADTKRLVEAEGRRCILIASDLSEQAGCQAVVDKVVNEFGRIDVLVNNASFQGKSLEGGLEEMSWERVEKTFRTNVIAMFELIHLCVPHMKPGASIINVGSIQAYSPSPGILDYSATKGAITTMTKALGIELAKDRGIRVNAIAPGPVWTPLIAQSYKQEKIESFGSQYPVGRPAQPAELAPAFVYLACPESSYVAGAVMAVTGGSPIH